MRQYFFLVGLRVYLMSAEYVCEAERDVKKVWGSFSEEAVEGNLRIL